MTPSYGRLGNDPFFLPLFLLAMADGLVFAGSVILAYAIRFNPPFTLWFPLPAGWDVPAFGGFFKYALLAGIVGVLVFERLGFYQSRIGTDRKVHVLRILLGVFIANMVLMVFLYFLDNPISRVTRILAFFLTIPLSVLAHYLLKVTYRHMIYRGIGYRRTLLLVDSMDHVEEKIQDLKKEHGTEFLVRGILLLKEIDGETLSKYKPMFQEMYLGDLSDMRRSLASRQFDTVLIAFSPNHTDASLQAISLCDLFRIDFYIPPDLFEKVMERIPVGKNVPLPILPLGDTPLAGSSVVIKRCFDIFFSGVLIALIAPVWCLLAILIKIESQGPVFYLQERVGHDGRLFKIIKLRSMRADAEQGKEAVWATRDDPRCTRLGGWMRRWNIDETPQLINVFRGEMSLVGPRPERPHFINQFKEDIPSYLRRHLVRSGMTGWAQIHGLRGDTSIRERIRYDIWYIQNWSFWLDIKILFRTIFAHKNAY